MGSDYTIDVKHRLNLGATPVDVKTLSFSTPKRTIASVLSETHSVLLFSIGDTFPTSRILVNEDPIEISGGGRDLAYVACRASRTIDVIRKTGYCKRIDLPGEPQSLAWNGSYNPTRQKIMVTCQMPGTAEGVVVVIDEETLSITNVLEVGKQPRGISLDWRRKHLLVSNYGSDSISIIDQAGTRVLATLPTAGQPRSINVSWSSPQDVIIALGGGGILQRMDASRFPPTLSGLTALKKPTKPPTSLAPYCCTPLDEDELWLVPDQNAEAIALVVSDERELKQVDYCRLGTDDKSEEGLGQVVISGHGLPGSLCIANRKRKELMFARMQRKKRPLSPRRAPSRGTR